ncbi:hypothetical protein Tco_1537712 [Tanacetum coccineum]
MVRYGIRNTWVDPAEAVPEITPMTVGEVNTRVTKLVELHKRDTQDLYALLEDAQDDTSGTTTGSEYSHSDTTPGPDGRDSLSDERHETRDRRHADQVASTARAAES